LTLYNRYHWLDGRALWQVTPPGAPLWLLDRVAPRPSPRPSFRGSVVKGGPYADAALRRALEQVMGAPVGTRNDTLYRAAFATAHFVLAGKLGEGVWRHALSEAATYIGLPPSEIASTLDSALRAREGASDG
jgi:hypothetical protein